MPTPLSNSPTASTNLRVLSPVLAEAANQHRFRPEEREPSEFQSEEFQSEELRSEALQTEQFRSATNLREDLHQRGHWLRAAMLGANDGIISVASLLLGLLSAGQSDMLLATGVAAWIAGAFSMASGEYVSVRAQADCHERSGNDVSVPHALQAALVSAAAFSAGAVFCLLALLAGLGSAGLAAATLVALGVLGAVSGWLSMTSPWRSATRVLVWGAAAMLVCHGLGGLIGGVVG